MMNGPTNIKFVLGVEQLWKFKPEVNRVQPAGGGKVRVDGANVVSVATVQRGDLRNQKTLAIVQIAHTLCNSPIGINQPHPHLNLNVGLDPVILSLKMDTAYFPLIDDVNLCSPDPKDYSLNNPIVKYWALFLLFLLKAIPV